MFLRKRVLFCPRALFFCSALAVREAPLRAVSANIVVLVFGDGKRSDLPIAAPLLGKNGLGGLFSLPPVRSVASSTTGLDRAEEDCWHGGKIASAEWHVSCT